MFRKLLVLLIFVISIDAQASGTLYGQVKNLHINEQGLILFKLTPDSGSSTFPSSDCGVSESDMWHFKVDTSNNFQKEFYSTLLTALASGRTIYAGHNSLCGSGHAAVIANYLYFKN
ncbi:MAG: hypothetical protein KZQ85_10960 [Candidatus Thiodiazotropha sp. (ex Myrtea sp. 'scaly one' KF741663)]|nr:hypothetical protein [Candidatus Thiodiazotropha sp. (ex Myrtea sp. 'scaly one' KF741663)]